MYQQKKTCPYDKREDFPFNIVQYAPIDSNVSRNTAYGVFVSQLIRYFRICNTFIQFQTRVVKIYQSFTELGYCKSLLKTKFLGVARKYVIDLKFEEATSILSTLFD